METVIQAADAGAVRAGGAAMVCDAPDPRAIVLTPTEVRTQLARPTTIRRPLDEARLQGQASRQGCHFLAGGAVDFTNQGRMMGACVCD